MQFEDAIIQMKEGKGVKNKHYENNEVYFINDDGYLVNQEGKAVWMTLGSGAILSDDWVVAYGLPMWKQARQVFNVYLEENDDDATTQDKELWEAVVKHILDGQSDGG